MKNRIFFKDLRVVCSFKGLKEKNQTIEKLVLIRDIPAISIKQIKIRILDKIYLMLNVT